MHHKPTVGCQYIFFSTTSICGHCCSGRLWIALFSLCCYQVTMDCRLPEISIDLFSSINHVSPVKFVLRMGPSESGVATQYYMPDNMMLWTLKIRSGFSNCVSIHFRLPSRFLIPVLHQLVMTADVIFSSYTLSIITISPSLAKRNSHNTTNAPSANCHHFLCYRILYFTVCIYHKVR
jgi:hypothetical protein